MLIKNNKLLVSIIVIFLLSSCGTQTRTPQPDADRVRALTEERKREIKDQEDKIWLDRFEKFQGYSSKLREISSNIRKRGAAFCKEREFIEAYIGINARSKYSIPERWQEVASTKFKLSEEVRLYQVDSDSPASIAGLKVNDTVLKINGSPIKQDKKAATEFIKKLKEIANYGEPVRITVRRDSVVHEFSFLPSRACKSEVFLIDDNTIGAYADGENIYVHQGMMEYLGVGSEDDINWIAFIISHELAHNIMKHSATKKINGVLTGLLMGGLIGLPLDIGSIFLFHKGPSTGGADYLFTKTFWDMGYAWGTGINRISLEHEADYVGLYLMALAGYEIENIPAVWRVFEQANPEIIWIKESHPTSIERTVAMEETVKEIKEKIYTLRPLIPEPISPFGGLFQKK